MFKKLNIAALTILVLFQTIFMPLGTYGVTFASAEAGEQSTSNEITTNIIKKVELYDNITVTNDVVNFGNSMDINSPDYHKPNVNNTAFLYFEWVLPAGVNPGDTFTFQLPHQFKMANNVSGRLDGDIGTFTVDQNGEVKLTFIDSTISEGMSGYFYVGSGFDKSKLGDSTKVDIEFDFKGDKENITIQFQSPITGGMTKKGVADRQKNPTKIDWEVDINLGEENYPNAYFVDDLPQGLELDGDVTFTPLKVSMNGEKSIDTSGTIFTKTKLVESIGPINQAYRVTYTTKVVGDFTGSKEFKNSAKLYDNDPSNGGVVKETKSATVNTSFNVPLEKSADNYDFVTGEITWTVKYNYNQKPVNGILDDTISTDKQTTAKHKFKEIVSVNEITFDAEGNEVVGPSVTGTFDTSTSQIKLPTDGGSTTKAYKIVYKTEVTDRVTESLTHRNKVCMNDNSEICAEITTKVDQKIINKTSSINYKDQTITWTLTVNEDKRAMPADTVIKDVFGPNLLLENVSDINLTGLDTTVSLYGENGAVDSTATSTSKGFEIKFNTGFNDTKTITYKTKFNPREGGLNAERSYTNTVGVYDNLDQLLTKATLPHTQSTGTYTQTNGSKQGNYDARTKKIKWTIITNYNQHSLTNGVFSDEYSAGQDFVESSLKIEKVTLGSAANSIGSATVVCEGTACNVIKTENGFTYNLGTTSDVYRITYETSLVGHEVKGPYTNNATLKDGLGPNIFEKSATVSPEYGNNPYVVKKGKQVGDLAKWKVTVNAQQSKINAGAEITDTLTGDHKLIDSSFTLYEVSVPADGKIQNHGGTELPSTGLIKVDASKYSLTTTDTAFTLSFNEAIEKPYILVYDSFIQADHNATISNGVSFNGSFSGITSQATSSNVKVNWALAGGGASSQKGKLQIEKVDKNNSNIKLPGATFNIYNGSGTILLETVTTDDHGIATTEGDYRYIKYLLEEVTAPKGYKKLENKFEATFNATTGIAVVQNEAFDSNSSCPNFTLTIQDLPTDLVGKEVTIKKDGTGPSITLGTLDSDGKITVSSPLSGGMYVVYVDDQELTQTIVVDGNCQATIKFIKGCSSFTLTINGVDSSQDGKVVEIVKNDDPTNTKIAIGTLSVTGTTGTVTAPSLPEGTYHIWIDGEELFDQITVDSDCQDDIGSAKICPDFTLTVNQMDGLTPVGEGITIIIKSLDGLTVVTEGTTDANGDIIFTDKTKLIEGTEYAVYNTSNVELGKIKVTYEEGNCHTAITVDSNSCPIFTLIVKDLSGKPRDTVQVIMKDQSGKDIIARGTTDTNGELTVPYTVANGSYKLYEEQNGVEVLLGVITVVNCQATYQPSIGWGGYVPPTVEDNNTNPKEEKDEPTDTQDPSDKPSNGNETGKTPSTDNTEPPIDPSTNLKVPDVGKVVSETGNSPDKIQNAIKELENFTNAYNNLPLEEQIALGNVNIEEIQNAITLLNSKLGKKLPQTNGETNAMLPLFGLCLMLVSVMLFVRRRKAA